MLNESLHHKYNRPDVSIRIYCVNARASTFETHIRTFCLHHLFTELKIYHLSLFITHIILSILPSLAARRTRVTYDPCKWPSSPRVSRSSVVGAPNRGIWETMGSIPVGTHTFFFFNRYSNGTTNIGHEVEKLFPENNLQSISFLILTMSS